MAEMSPEQAMVRDPLSQVTRRERTLLLGVSLIGITIAKTGLIPSRITALNVEIGKADLRPVLIILALVTAYFLVAFVLYALADMIARNLAYREALKDAMVRRAELKEHGGWTTEDEEEFYKTFGRERFPRIFLKPVASFRLAFDFGLPILVGIYEIVTLFTTSVR